VVMREVVNGLMYILATGCQWRAIPKDLPPKSTITAYLEAGGTLENAQAMAAHESPRTTKLYDRTGDEITLDEVERITI
jgi:transposase